MKRIDILSALVVLGVSFPALGQGEQEARRLKPKPRYILKSERAFQQGDNVYWSYAQLTYMHWSIVHGFEIPASSTAYQKSVEYGPKRGSKRDTYTGLYKDLDRSLGASLKKIVDELRRAQRRAQRLKKDIHNRKLRQQLEKASEPIKRIAKRTSRARKALASREKAINKYILTYRNRIDKDFDYTLTTPLSTFNESGSMIVQKSDEVLRLIQAELAGLQKYTAHVDAKLAALVAVGRADPVNLAPHPSSTEYRKDDFFQQRANEIIEQAKSQKLPRKVQLPDYVRWKWNQRKAGTKTLTDVTAAFIKARRNMRELRSALDDLSKVLDGLNGRPRRSCRKKPNSKKLINGQATWLVRQPPSRKWKRGYEDCSLVKSP